MRLLGPGFVAAIAYVDPGNFATNIAAGSRYGYALVWVIVAANLMAVLVQYLSTKLGLVTGKSLPEACRDRYPGPLRWFLWGQAELVAIATDIAEFLGAAIALRLLFGWSAIVAAGVTAVAALVMLSVQQRGYRAFEILIAGFMTVIAASFAVMLLGTRADLGELIHGLRPSVPGDGLLLIVGIVGATVMPHVVYLHSALVTDRIATPDDASRRRLLRFMGLDVVLAMILAGAVNLAMLVFAAAALHGTGTAPAETLDQAHATILATLGVVPAAALAVALLASGLSSSSVGTLAGQVIMQGFVDRRIPLGVRRSVTMAPAVVVLIVGVEPTTVLILSQVVLSFGIPFALIPLVHLTSSRRLMGPFANGWRIAGLAGFVAVIVIGLNVWLLAATLGLG
ncbi:MAG: manganese transport protein [Chloroflexota bacterium]|jgi:manganese transport protein|nr:manganese transport protein [Chloroflexota bacterium]